MIKNLIKNQISATIIEHTDDSPYKITKIIKSGIKELYHVITEWKTEHTSHRMMRQIEIIESFPITGYDLPTDKEKKQTKL